MTDCSETCRHAKTPGHPHAQGTLPMARLLTDPAVEEWIQQMAASAPPMTEDQRARLSRLLRFNRTETGSRPHHPGDGLDHHSHPGAAPAGPRSGGEI